MVCANPSPVSQALKLSLSLSLVCSFSLVAEIANNMDPDQTAPTSDHVSYYFPPASNLGYLAPPPPPGNFFMGAKLFIGTPECKTRCPKNWYWLCENAWLPLDEWTCQIVPLIILEHATMKSACLYS